jgi:transglutaminase-like putative cysteine protease
MRAVILTFVALSSAAGAASAAPVTTLSTEVVYELAADGTWTVDRKIVTRVNEQAAVMGAGQAGIQYSESLQKLEILEAYTTTKDGQRVDVPADRIMTQQLPASAGAPTFSDYKVKSVVFPQVEVGATLTLHFRVEQVKPFLPGVFTSGEVYNRLAEIQHASLTLRAPEKAHVQIHSRGVPGGQVKSGRPGVSEWQWTYGPSVAEPPEPGSVDPATISPGVSFSTLQDLPALADAYMTGAAPAAKVTSAVQQLADQITQGVSDRRAQAEAIYHWVSSEIRYVAIAMGVGGYVPHNADEIIAARYGDCKDKTTLLTALLHAKGIRAVPVLVRTGERYRMPDVPLLQAFNHAITYLPEFDLYLDATIALAPFDSLTAALRGRSVLVAGDARTKAAVRQTPDVNPDVDRTMTLTSATVGADGTVQGTTRVQVYGAPDAALRTTLSLLPAQVLPQLARQMLASTGQSGEAKLTLGDLRDFKQANLLTIDFTVPGRINLPGPGALTGAIGMQGSDAKSFVTNALRMERKLDFPCPAGGSEDRLELALPEGMKITNLPGPADITSPYGHFTAGYEVQEGKLVIREQLDLHRRQTVCTAADDAQLHKFATAIDHELRKQILYQ